MFGIGIKGIGSLMKGNVNDLIKDNLKNYYPEITSIVRDLAKAKYSSELSEGEEIGLMFFERNNNIILIVGAVRSADFTVTKVFEKHNLYDLLMSLDYEEMMKQAKEQSNGSNTEPKQLEP